MASNTESPLCRLFQIHPHASYPSEPPKLNRAELDALSIDGLLTKIGKVPYHKSFPALFQDAKSKGKLPLSSRQVKNYLHCVLFYISQDTDNDNTPDWSAITNNQITNILIPLDPDINGNGVWNLFDPEPFEYHQVTTPSPNREIPAHLRMAADETTADQDDDTKTLCRAEIQERLWHQHGIIAVDHTDQHSPIVLGELLTMLENSLGYFRQRTAQSFLTLYAFRGHDANEYMAAYHQEIRAISIGGKQAYPETKFSERQKIHVLASLAHEIGHDFIFSHLNAQKLREVGTRLGGWDFMAGENAESLYDPAFLLPHPKRETFSNGAQPDSKQLYTFSFTSQYSFTNIHEWFADAFAGWLLQSLGQKGFLGKNWQDLLLRTPGHSQAYWVNYKNTSSSFTAWLDQKVNSIESAKISGTN